MNSTPRIVIAGTSSGAGKTTVACGLMAALAARGMRVQPFKVGPDFIDPSYHTLAAGRPGRNLDAFLSGTELIAQLTRHGIEDLVDGQAAEIAVVEGVMGLFDGASGRGELASTGQIAKLLSAPVILVVDGSAMSRSAAAIVHGFATFDPQINVAGVIFNRVGSDHHEQLLREAVQPLGIPVLGVLPRDERIKAPERHLGLVPAQERDAHTRDILSMLAAHIEERIDLDALVALAKTVDPLECSAWNPGELAAEQMPGTAAGLEAFSSDERADEKKLRIAVAQGQAFSFHYRENWELLQAFDCDLIPFDPLSDPRLPEDIQGIIFAGGFPEVFAKELTGNLALRQAVAAAAANGIPIWAECGGLLYLCDQLDGLPMCGVIPAQAQMGKRLSLGYRDATVSSDSQSAWVPAGTEVRGHEFHYSRVEPTAGERAAWHLSSRMVDKADGFGLNNVHASYLHTHLAAFPQLAGSFVVACREFAGQFADRVEIDV